MLLQLVIKRVPCEVLTAVAGRQLEVRGVADRPCSVMAACWRPDKSRKSLLDRLCSTANPNMSVRRRTGTPRLTGASPTTINAMRKNRGRRLRKLDQRPGH